MENKEERKYNYNIICNNCRVMLPLQIPFGCTVKKHIAMNRKIICDLCGCDAIKS